MRSGDELLDQLEAIAGLEQDLDQDDRGRLLAQPAGGLVRIANVHELEADRFEYGRRSRRKLQHVVDVQDRIAHASPSVRSADESTGLRA
jgi:hypothetical protein